MSRPLVPMADTNSDFFFDRFVVWHAINVKATAKRQPVEAFVGVKPGAVKPPVTSDR
jgi:hypothetical protein